MADLPKRQLGRTGLQVTTMSYGAMELRGAPRGRPVDPDDGGVLLNAVLDAGINYIDTSIDYGQSEELIGKYISHRRSEYFLASKCGCLLDPGDATARGPMPHVFTPENIVAGVNQSLARMRTDYLDVVQFHNGPSTETLIEMGAIDAIQGLKREGKIRFIGMSSILPNLESHLESDLFDVFQLPYSALQREHEEMIGRAAQQGVGTVIRGGAAKGVTSDGNQNGSGWDIWQSAKLDELLDRTSRMDFILRFTTSHPGLSTTIVGTINRDHLEQGLDAVRQGPLSPEIYEEAKRRLAQANG